MVLSPLKLARMRRGQTQFDVSRATGIERSRLSLLENQHVTPHAEEVERLARALGVPPRCIRPQRRGTTT